MLGFYYSTDRIIRIMFIVAVSVIHCWLCSSANHNLAHYDAHCLRQVMYNVTQSSDRTFAIARPAVWNSLPFVHRQSRLSFGHYSNGHWRHSILIEVLTSRRSVNRFDYTYLLTCSKRVHSEFPARQNHGTCSSVITTTLFRWSKLNSTRWSHGVKNWPSASSSAVCCQKRRASIICYRTSVTSPSPADCVMQEHLND